MKARRPPRYSIAALLRNAVSWHENWPRAWRSPPLQPAYDIVIIGGGGHGLATAAYLARDHRPGRIAVLEKGWIGGGNTGRNTVTIRSNYLRPESIAFFHESVGMWERLGRELNFNVMFSQRGQIDLIQSWPKLRDVQRRVHTMRLFGAPYEIIAPDEVRRRLPILGECRRLPILAGAWHAEAGIARHDAVAWGYARLADAFGVDIVQNCEVTGVRRQGRKVIGVETNRGFVGAGRIGVAVAGHAGVVANMAGLRLPIETVPLQAFVSEPVKPILDIVVNAPALHVYLAQTDKGELIIGGAAERYPFYAQRGSFAVIEETVGGLVELFPMLGSLRLMRQWAGIIDLCWDTSPIISKTDLDGLFFSAGWGSGGFKAIPAGGRHFARLIATGEPDPVIAPFGLSRFANLRPVIETAGASNRE